MSNGLSRHKGSARSKQAPATPELVVDENNRTPLYHQLFLILRSKIHDGEYANGSYLPSEHKLAATYKVSRITAIRALNELAAQGMVVRERGRGTRVRFVSRGTVVRGPSGDRPNSNGFVRNLHGIVRDHDEADYQVLSFEALPAPPDVAGALAVPLRTEIYRAIRLGYFEGKPYRYLTTYVPAEIGKKWTNEDLAQNSVVDLLRRSGATIDRIVETVTATLADAVVSRHLRVATGGPLIKLVRTAQDARHRPIEYVIALYAPDRFQYIVSMDRRR